MKIYLGAIIDKGFLLRKENKFLWSWGWIRRNQCTWYISGWDCSHTQSTKLIILQISNTKLVQFNLKYKVMLNKIAKYVNNKILNFLNFKKEGLLFLAFNFISHLQLSCYLSLILNRWVYLHEPNLILRSFKR